jgi:hypothetical protein
VAGGRQPNVRDGRLAVDCRSWPSLRRSCGLLSASPGRHAGAVPRPNEGRKGAQRASRHHRLPPAPSDRGSSTVRPRRRRRTVCDRTTAARHPCRRPATSLCPEPSLRRSRGAFGSTHRPTTRPLAVEAGVRRGNQPATHPRHRPAIVASCKRTLHCRPSADSPDDYWPAVDLDAGAPGTHS